MLNSKSQSQIKNKNKIKSESTIKNKNKQMNTIESVNNPDADISAFQLNSASEENNPSNNDSNNTFNSNYYSNSNGNILTNQLNLQNQEKDNSNLHKFQQFNE